MEVQCARDAGKRSREAIRMNEDGKKAVEVYQSSSGMGIGPSIDIDDTTVWDPIGDLSFPLSKSSPVFHSASASAVAAFDFSELTGVVSLNKSIGFNEKCLDSSVDVCVPGVLRPVDIPNHFLFTEVAHRLNLKMFGMGMVTESAGVYCAWIDVEVPDDQVANGKGRKKFYGLGSCSKYGAVESVCKSAVTYLCEEHNVVVKDFNYLLLKKLEAEIAREKQWSSMVQDALMEEKKKVDKLKEEVRLVYDQVLDLLWRFSDTLPISFSFSSGHEPDLADVEVLYEGSRPPVTRDDKLALRLVSLLKGGSNQSDTNI